MSYEELIENAKHLAEDDRHSKAIENLRRALGGTTYSDDQKQLINAQIVELQRTQQSRFDEILVELERKYLNEKVQYTSSEEMEDIYQKIEALKNIDRGRSRVDLEQRIATLELDSQVQWEFDRINKEVVKATRDAHASGVGSDIPLKDIEHKLQNSILPEWENKEHTDRVAGKLVPRLITLLNQVSQSRSDLAQKIGILTTMAGNINFWAIEELYQGWTNPKLRKLGDVPPTQMPKMMWEQVEDAQNEGKKINTYKAIGPLLPLDVWRDEFYADARKHAKGKAAENFPRAEDALKRGRPLEAKTIASSMVYGNEEKNVKPYFQLPEEWETKIEAFLVSDELTFSLRQYEKAKALLDSVPDTPEDEIAWKKYTEAHTFGIDVTVTAGVVRKSIVERITRAMRALIREAEDELQLSPVNPEQVKVLDSKAVVWLTTLPDYERDEEMSQRLDPEGALRPLREALQCQRQLYRFAQGLLQLQNEIDPTNGPVNLNASTQQFAHLKNEIIAKGFKTSDVPLFDTLQKALATEEQTLTTIQQLWMSTDVFPADPGATDTKKLIEALTMAKGNPRPEYKSLTGALEARYKLYQEVTGTTLALEIRKTSLRDVINHEYVRVEDKSYATQRLETLTTVEQRTSGTRRRITTAEGLAQMGTHAGIQSAWTELLTLLKELGASSNDANSNNSELVTQITGEVLAAQVRIRKLLDAAIAALKEQYPADKPLQEQGQADDLIKWKSLIKEVALGATVTSFDERFNPLLWQWRAENNPDSWERMQALLSLARVNPSSKAKWEASAFRAALAWAIKELEVIREELSTNRQFSGHTVNDRLNKLLHDMPPEVEVNIAANHQFRRKKAEVYVWIGDLENARHAANLGQAQGTDGTHIAHAISESDLTELIDLAAMRKELWNWLAMNPTQEIAEQLHHKWTRFTTDIGN